MARLVRISWVLLGYVTTLILALVATEIVSSSVVAIPAAAQGNPYWEYSERIGEYLANGEKPVDRSVVVAIPAGYVYCQHDMKVHSLSPQDGVARPRYGIGGTYRDRVVFRYKLRSKSQKIVQNIPIDRRRSWVFLDAKVKAIREDLAPGADCTKPLGGIPKPKGW